MSDVNLAATGNHDASALGGRQVQQILSHPDFRQMAAKKASLGRWFTLIVVVMYVSYLLMLGGYPQLFATPVSAGSTTTWGIYLGLGVILVSILLTGIYVHKANGEFDALTQKVVSEVAQDIV